MQKILIVDDEKMMLKMASRILSKNYEVVCANSGAEAVELFDTEKPDMVLSDLLMPGMDGYELQRILQEKSAEPVPIMFMTADESDESESLGFELGAADYIRKPLKTDILLRRIANILEHAQKIHGLKRAVDIDRMTGLLNKSAAQSELEKICGTSHGVLMMIDLDSFKLINDIHGHEMGDKILITFAELLKSITRSSDLVGRMGGDEFIAFCQNIHDENIISDKTKFLNEKIFNSAKNFIGDDMNIPLGVSIGAVFVPDEGKNFLELYQKADKALYKVKQHGKHGFAIYSENDRHEEESSPQNFSSIAKILGERSEPRGAFFLELEKFKIVYQLSCRLVANYQKGIQFIKLTLSSNNETDVENFQNLLVKILRKSDCVTKFTKNQFFILLMESTLEETEIVKNRIVDKMKTVDNLSNLEIDFDANSL